MIVDGKRIAQEMRAELARACLTLPRTLSLAVFITQETFVIKKFVDIKAKAAGEVGVDLSVYTLKPLENTEDLVRHILAASRTHDGILVQMPLAPGISLTPILKTIPFTHDVDVIGTTAFTHFEENRLPILPPVVGAMQEILFRHGTSLAGRSVAVMGYGNLVGRPAAVWAKQLGASVSIITSETEHVSEITKAADVVILGVGQPGTLTPDMIKDGVIILDAGTSEEGGKLAGDADPACAQKASLITPVPGGIGPIAVSKVFENLLSLYRLRHPNREP